MPTVGQRRHDLVEEDLLGVGRRARATRSRISIELLARGPAVGRRCAPTPATTWSFRPATRTWKNSSRFWLKMAQNLARSSSGTPDSSAQRQHAGVEVEPGQLAVEVPLGGRSGASAVGQRRRSPRSPGRRWSTASAGSPLDARARSSITETVATLRRPSRTRRDSGWRQVDAGERRRRSTSRLRSVLGQAEVPVEQDVLALGVADDALAVAAELRVVRRQELEAGLHPVPEARR